MIKSDKFFELLISDDKDKIHEFIMANGKSSKPVCPIRFIKEDNETEGDDSNGSSNNGEG